MAKKLTSLISVGADPGTIEAARDALLEIIEATSGRADAVTIAAIESFTKLCAVSNTTISNCTLSGGGNG